MLRSSYEDFRDSPISVSVHNTSCAVATDTASGEWGPFLFTCCVFFWTLTPLPNIPIVAGVERREEEMVILGDNYMG